jgi:exosortase
MSVGLQRSGGGRTKTLKKVAPEGLSVERTLQLKWIAFAVLLVISYWSMLSFTGRVLSESEDMAHGFFAPLVCAAIVWQKRSRVVALRSSGSAWGLTILSVAAVLAVISAIGASSTLSRLAFLGSLTGAIVLLGGWRLLRELSLPLLLLFFTFPIPPVLYGEITQPLQLLASAWSESTLELLGYSVLREGNILQLPNQRLSVVEACSGIRSLVTLSFFCLVYVYQFEPRRWKAALLVLASVPAAILVNMLRITTTGIIGENHPELTKGLAHESLGWALFAVGFGLVVLLQMTLRTLARRSLAKRSCGDI